MIRYALKCADGHAFESWFQSSEAFDALTARGLVVCETCGSPDVQKSLMAPKVGASEKGSGDPEQVVAAGPLSRPGSKMEQMVTELRQHLEANSTYVGRDFAREAREMHLGELPERQIHGEASPDEARALVEDGIPILPVPGPPRNKTN